MSVTNTKLCFWCGKMVDRDEFNTHVLYEGHTEVRSLRTFRGHLKVLQENAERIRREADWAKSGRV
jgi:hypothetical protein